MIPLALQRADYLGRRKRFFADVRLADGRIDVAHLPNTGSMRSLPEGGVPCWLLPAANPARTLRWTLVLLGLGNGGLALVDTSQPNRLVAEAVAAGLVPALAGYATARREVPYGSRNSRCDLLLEDPLRPRCVVEVKNCTMRSPQVIGRADFPDAVTERGTKHLAELADVARAGERAVLFYLLGRDDCQSVGVAQSCDPAYAVALRQAQAAGVEVLAYRARLSSAGIALGERTSFTAS